MRSAIDSRAEDLAASPTPRPALSGRDELGPIQMPDDTEWSVEYQRWCIENRYTPGATIEVNLSQIKPSPFNPGTSICPDVSKTL